MTSAESPLCKDELVKRTRTIMDTIKTRPDYLTDKEAVPVLTKAVLLGNTILRQASQSPSASTQDSVLSAAQKLDDSILSKYSQFLIEFSYAIEVKLVNEEFKSEDATRRISEINGYLDQVVDAVSFSGGLSSDEASAVSGSGFEDLLECVFWRKGALMYMYCHTATDNPTCLLSTSQQKQTFLDYASRGIHHLAKEMKDVRKCNTDYTSNDSDSLELVRSGIYSDTHVLACMYSAELCYWIELMADGNSDSTISIPSKLDQGYSLATEYLKLARGPLKQHNWNTSKAEEMIQYYKSKQSSANS